MRTRPTKRTLIVGADANALTLKFFPPEARVEELKIYWHCKQLSSPEEEVLAGDPAYRFTYIPSDRPTLIAVISMNGNTPRITGKVLSGKGGYEPGYLAHENTRNLSQEELTLVRERLEAEGVWDDEAEDETGFDGSAWILEGRKDGMPGRRGAHD